MYKDIIQYSLAQNVDHAAFLAIAKQVYQDWMQHLHGFILWEIHTNNKGGYTDIVIWKNKAAAQKAELDMRKNPSPVLKKWEALYDPVGMHSQQLEEVAVF